MKQAFTAAFCGALVCAGIAKSEPIATLHPAQPGIFRIGSGELTLELTVEAKDDIFAARYTVLENGVAAFTRELDDIYSLIYGPMFQLVEMDAHNNTPEIWVNVYSGGAHCCNLVSVHNKTPDGWDTYDAGAFDGDPQGVSPRDADGDGMSEIVTYDNAFLYQFSSYAESRAPKLVLGFRNNEMVDLSADPAFEFIVRDSLNDLGAIPESGAARNSWLATYAATLLLLGEDDPLDYAVSAYDPGVNWGLQKCAVDISVSRCPADKLFNYTFPQALQEFLVDNGYLPDG